MAKCKENTVLDGVPIGQFEKIAKQNHCKIYLFGSRVWGTPRRNSDLDIAIEGAPSQYLQCVDDLTNSNCYYMMDFVNMNLLNNMSLKERILSHGFQI